MTEEEFVRISRFLKNKYGIDMSRKKEIMQGRLENAVRTRGFRNYHEYMNALEMDFSGSLEKELVDLLTTNHTFFGREFEHFEYLRHIVLPELKKKEDKTKDLSIWCGAASTGQEPYMLAMLLKDFFGFEHQLWDTKVLATDISSAALRQAIKGKYTGEQIADLQDNWKHRFFRLIPQENCYEVTQEIKDEVLFRQFNLMDPFPFRRKMHIVFLRNVMIYFDKDTKNELLQKVFDLMEPGGYLFVGQTETVDRAKIPFDLVQPSIFRKQEENR